MTMTDGDVPQCLAGPGGQEYERDMDVTHAQLFERISIDPARCGGRPCIRGHRIWVWLVLDMFASGATVAGDSRRLPGPLPPPPHREATAGYSREGHGIQGRFGDGGRTRETKTETSAEGRRALRIEAGRRQGG